MSAQTPFDALVSVEEQDAWAYVATGQEEYGPWVRYRARTRDLAAETKRENAAHRAVLDSFRAQG